MKKGFKSIGLGLILVFASSLTLQAQKAKNWNVDKSHASVNFSIDHFFSAVTGKFKNFSGDVVFDPSDLKGSKVSFEIQVNSISTDDEERDHHLQSEDFFAAEKYPTIKFVSTGFTKVSDNEFTVTGKLTMRGVTKTITLPLKVTGRMANPWKEGYEILGVSIKTALDRTDYEVGTGSWAATSVVGDEVTISISMELDAKI
tara:strand:- start:59664 stop:60266 length:603 start_codon:yes stop_codon:yes gene_type:complete